MLMNGLHVCSIPKYGKKNVVEPKDFQPLSLLDPKQKKCLHFDIPDLMGLDAFEKAEQEGKIGHGDIPDNYLCFDGKKTSQYFDAIVPEAMQSTIKEGLKDMTAFSGTGTV